jgi:SAM-dependent methyltransferase
MEMNQTHPILSPQELFGSDLETVLNMIADNSPFPRGKGEDARQSAKVQAARIHLCETVYFGQIAYQTLKPLRLVEVCSGYGLPALVVAKQFGIHVTCVDIDEEGLAVGRVIAENLQVSLNQVKEDLFSYLRKEGKSLTRVALLTTAAFCFDQENNRPHGSGESDLVDLAIANGMDLAILPYRSGETMKTGVSQEKKRLSSYQERLVKAGYDVMFHSTRHVLPQTGAPDWFYLDIMTAKRNTHS